MPGRLSQAGCAQARARTHSLAPPMRRARRSGGSPSTRPCRRSRSRWGCSSTASCRARASSARAPRNGARSSSRVHGECGTPRAVPTHMIARVALRASSGMCCARPQLSARSPRPAPPTPNPSFAPAFRRHAVRRGDDAFGLLAPLRLPCTRALAPLQLEEPGRVRPVLGRQGPHGTLSPFNAPNSPQRASRAPTRSRSRSRSRSRCCP